MQRIPKMARCQFRFLYVIAVGLVDDNAIRHLHDTPFDALQFISRARQLNQQKEIHHGVYRSFTLPHSHRFDEYLIKPSCLAQDNRLTGLSCHSAQRTCRGAGADKSIGMDGQFLHAGLIAQDTAFGTLTAGVDGQDSQLSSLSEHMQPENINGGTLAGTRHSADSDTNRPAGIRETFLYNLLSDGLMFGFHTLHQCHGLTQDGHVTFHNTFHILSHRKLTATRFLAEFQIRIHNGWLFNARIDDQSLIFFTIFRMFHSYFFEVTFTLIIIFGLFGSFVIINTRGEPFTLLRLCP